MTAIHTFLSGLGIGLSFILAIGAQNAYVLKQGLKGQQVATVCLTCALSDTILIVAGVIGHHRFRDSFPQIGIWLLYAGTIFLILYGLKSLYQAFTSHPEWKNYFSSPKGMEPRRSRIPVILTTLGFTWLNPHVYVDTLIIIGSLSQKFPEHVMAYTAGAVTASYLFFFGLGYGARILNPLFHNPRAWRILDGLIGSVMFILAWVLIRESL